MSLRTLTRVVALGLALIVTTPLFWPAAGPLPALAGLALLVLAAGYLALGAGGPPTTCWQIRYVLEDQELGRLDEMLKFLAARAGQVVLEASGQGLFHWGVSWKQHKKYPTLDEVRTELGSGQGSRVAEFSVADHFGLDLRVPAGSEAVSMGCYPQGTVPGVRLGIAR